MASRIESIDDFDVQWKYKYEGLTLQEIADYYGVCVATIYRRLNPEKPKKYVQTENGKEAHKRANKKYSYTDKGKERLKQWQDSHPEYMKEYRQTEKYITYMEMLWQSDKGKDIRRRANAIHRQLGFIPLNTYIDGGEWHHIDKEHVICIPANLHRSIWHNLENGQGMEAINTIAFRYITEETFDMLIAGEI